ncbi:integrase core domain-containing protein [Acetobacter pasteurianus]|uniref:integrase core domain-containing protein n=1 Tax=Acetobacter TaxID=434 RepID=UPI000676E2BD|nr:hypothetical protein DB34_10780 [Acetobacter pasteurianus]
MPIIILNDTLFMSLEHTREALAAWKHHYNTVPQHSQFRGKTLDQIAKQRFREQTPLNRWYHINIRTQKQKTLPFERIQKGYYVIFHANSQWLCRPDAEQCWPYLFQR